jgi:hypothetical protein
MTLDSAARNRVSPRGEIVAATGRGAWMGNRGRLHEGRGTRDVVRNHQSKTWITCALSFKGRRLAQWEPNRYTLLFFLDEAVALAAGHRPCAECRRSAYNAFRTCWVQTHGGAMPYAKDMDTVLHRERIGAVGHQARWDGLPDGVFVDADGEPAVVVGDHLAVWDRRENGYTRRLSRPVAGTATLITPPSIVAVIRARYPVQIDPAAC